ncbi:actin filament-associated protein 1-like 2 [Anneissia japonica]|uniref:actin filament-associated protein 1-like 2 n=1 Tax=Anneissia japonica TaxID=1529436 RepID=UPI0014257E33|nr:actin filament-associated protein 1-like 2 [Anneissia japonica]
MLSVEELAAQRNLSWHYANIPSKKIGKPKVIQTDDIYETPINEDDILKEKSYSSPDSDQEEYEVPLVSENIGSPSRAIDDDGEVYEEPGDYENTNHQGRVIEDDDVYEDPEDKQDGANGGLSDASGSYESFDSDEYIDDTEKSAPSLPEKSKPLKQSRNTKAEQFKTRCENDPYIIHSGILSFKTYSGTLSRISLGKWSIKYCIVYKGLLSLYNKPLDKTPSKNLTLFGYNITEQGPESKYEHVFGIQHQGQSTQNFATTTRENLETWIKVLQEESTNADNIPTYNKDPHSPPVEQSDSTLKGKIKISNLVKRRSKPVPIQLSEDKEGNLAGLVNILSPVNGEPKWKERFCFVTSQLLHVYKDVGAEKLIFSQPLKGMEIGQGKPNIKRKNTLTLYQGDTVYVYIQAVNHVDHGNLLSKLIKETGFGESLESAYITPSEQMDMPRPKTSTSKQPSIFSLMQRFEMPAESDDTSKAGTHDSVYLEMEDPSETKPDTPTFTVEDTGNDDTEPVYENNAIRSTWIRSKLQKHSPNIKKKNGKEKEEKEKDKEKKEKKEKKKKKKKDKEKKSVEEKEDTEENTESVDVSSQLSTQTSSDAPATEDVAEIKVKEKTPTQDAPKIENKFVTSDKKHLLDVDRLQSERKILLEKREDLRIRKTELRWAGSWACSVAERLF